MEVNRNDDGKLIEVWLTNAEKNDESVKKRLNVIYSQGVKEKYKVAVFESGEADLYESIEGLIIGNMSL